MAEVVSAPKEGYPIKLVRDYIGDRLGNDGSITYEPVGDDAAHVESLRRKLIGGAAEYLTNPSVGELADVLEVVWALARVDLRTSFAAVEKERLRKYEDRG